MNLSASLLTYGMVLALIQVAAALPWVLVVGWDALRSWYRAAPGRRLANLVSGLAVTVLAAGAALSLLLATVRQRANLELYGRVYAAVLQLQLTADLFALFFVALLALWPKGGAVARAAFRESYRQPMFWLIGGAGCLLLMISLFLPYFTFGEDHIMFKQLGYDITMLAAMLFGVLAASMSISEEIEGRTAVTLMSKPVSRRQFLLGKYLGILLTCLVLMAALGWFFDVALLYKYWLEHLKPKPVRVGSWQHDVLAWVDRLGGAPEGRNVVRGAALWVLHAGEILPGQIMSCSLVLVMVALAVALATRLPMVVNLVTCLVIYFLANLMPVLVKSTDPGNQESAGLVRKLLFFMAQLFDALLPGLDLFRVRPTLVDESSLKMSEYLRHVGSVTLYGGLFTALVLLLGLVLFEDRDLA